MQKTTDLALEARVRDKLAAKDPAGIPKHVADFQKESWSYSFTKYPFSGDPIELENLSDFDSIAIKLAIARFRKGGMAFVHLEQYLADVSNMVGYGILPIASYVQLKLVRSLTNSRIRSRLSTRKPFDLCAVF